MKKQNCWEVRQCGRGPGSNNGHRNNICPAALDKLSNGLNGGINGGRICWIIAGTFCNGIVQGSFAQKRQSCITCSFFKMVEAEEGFDEFKVLRPGQIYNP